MPEQPLEKEKVCNEKFMKGIDQAIMASEKSDAIIKTRITSNNPRLWFRIGTLEIPDKILVASDIGYYPDDLKFGAVLNCPTNIAQVFLEALEVNPDDIRVSAILLRFLDGKWTEISKIGETGIDGGSMLIGSQRTLKEHWKRGGPKNRTILKIDTEEKNKEFVRSNAINLLISNGISMTKDQYNYDVFAKPLSENEINAIEKLLQRYSLPVKIEFSPPHSAQELMDLLEHKLVARFDIEKQCITFAFETGLGDGDYDWYQLYSNDKIIAFYCHMINDEDLQ